MGFGGARVGEFEEAVEEGRHFGRLRSGRAQKLYLFLYFDSSKRGNNVVTLLSEDAVK
jgi:hypothetical protein